MTEPHIDIVGAVEIVARAHTEHGVILRRKTVNTWHARRKEWEAAGSPSRRAKDEPMPAPLAGTVSGNPAWNWPDIVAWMRRTNKIPAPAPSDGKAADG